MTSDRDRSTTTNNEPAMQDEKTTCVTRRPYVAPRLKHLGSVRDLTLGTSNKAGEGGMRNM